MSSRQAAITRTVDELIARGVPVGMAIAQAVSAPSLTAAPARWVTLADGRVTRAS